MKIASLQLEWYFISDLHLTANKEFDRHKVAAVNYENLAVEVECIPDKDNPRKWQVTLKLKHQGTADANSPYSFSLELVGFMQVAKTYPDKKVEKLVRTNGPSMLYGVAREVLRDLTARGPHVTIFLPSVSFDDSTNAGPPATPVRVVASSPAP